MYLLIPLRPSARSIYRYCACNSTSIKIRNEGDVRSAKMIETRHGLESNPVPTSILSFIAILALLGSKMDVGTGLDSRPCLVSIIFADLTSLHPTSFH